MNWAEYLGLAELCLIILGLVYAFRQFSLAKRNREFRQSHTLLTSFHSPEYARGLALVSGLSIDNNIQKFSELSLDERSSLVYLMNMFESFGAMVFYNQIKIELVEEYFCGTVLASWDRLEPWIQQERDTFSVYHYEWFEWLVLKLQAREGQRMTPAHRRSSLAQ